MNYVDQVFSMLGIKANELFKIKGYQASYSINDNLRIKIHSSEHLNSSFLTIADILNGSIEIQKLPTLTAEEQLVVDYIKLCNYHYVAKDEDGEIYMYREAPKKSGGRWLTADWDVAIEIPYGLSFVSWEDKEPFCIDVLMGEK